MYLTERLELEELPEYTTVGRPVSSGWTSLFDKTNNIPCYTNKNKATTHLIFSTSKDHTSNDNWQTQRH